MTKNAPKLVKRDGAEVTKGRISPALRSAIKLIYEEGFSVADAAKSVGYKVNSLSQALGKPHVRALVANVKRAHRDSETERAWAIVGGLARESASDDVRLKAARTILQAAGELDGHAEGRGTPQALINIVLNSGRVAEVIEGGRPGVIEAPAR